MPTREHEFRKWIVGIRRDLHMYPEISNHETRTTKKITGLLKEWNIEVQELHEMTGVVGLIRGSGSGKTMALRADIDALPIQELNDVPHRSKHDGVMHACGHDANTAIMLGVAKKMMDSGLAQRIKGNVKFLFQPAEERLVGAKVMIAQGVLENPRVDRIFAGHMAPDLPVGQVSLFKGISHAMPSNFRLTIKGCGCHGSAPHLGIDPINAGAYFVTAIQSIISRSTNPLDSGVVTIGEFHAGTAPNIISNEVMITGTIRVLKQNVQDLILQRLSEIVEGLEKTFRVETDLKIDERIVPVLVNEESATDLLYNSAKKVIGDQNVLFPPPVMGSEDFALFTKAVPGAFIRIGCGKSWDKNVSMPLHSPYFDIDEAVLPIGVEIFTEAVKKYLS